MGLTTSSIQQEGISIGGSFHLHVIEYQQFSVLNFLLISYLNFLNLSISFLSCLPFQRHCYFFYSFCH